MLRPDFQIGDKERTKPCDTCTEGNNVNPVMEKLAIVRYLRKHPEFEPLTREELARRRTERSRAEMDEAKRYHAEWIKLHVTAKGNAVDRTQERLAARQQLIEAQYGPALSGPELLKIAGTGTPKRKPKGGTR